MMKSKRWAPLFLALVMISACACAQTLPGIDVFSPGLVRLAERMTEDPAVHMEAQMTVGDAFHARDLSVLRAMLEGTTFVYDGTQGENGSADRLTIERGGQTLFTGAACGDAIEINGQAYAVNASEMAAQDENVQALMNFLQTTPILERAPLETVESALLALQAGQRLFGGFAVASPFTAVRTMSDDGTRLVRINISGSIAREGEAPWVIEGYLKQPAGRAPKDTFELTAAQDEDNMLELSYSSLRKSEITKKNKAGTASVDTAVKAAGKIGGYRVNSRLTVYLRSNWTADGEKLKEKVVVNATLEHQDNTPGREMMRLNKVEGKMRHEIDLTTVEGENETIALADEMTVSLVMDEKTTLDAAAQMNMTVGEESTAPAIAQNAQPADAQQIEDAIADATAQLAQRLYAQMSDKTKAAVQSGFE